MKKIRSYIYLCLCMVVVISLSSCNLGSSSKSKEKDEKKNEKVDLDNAKQVKKAIVGDWRLSSGDLHFYFKKDGSGYRKDGDDDSSSFEWDYNAEGHTLYVSMDGYRSEEDELISLSGSKMVFKSNGEKVTFVRDDDDDDDDD